MSAALRLQSTLLLRLLLLLLVICSSDASFAIPRPSNSILLGLVVGKNTKRAVRIDSTILLLHGSGGEGGDNKETFEDKQTRRSNRKEEEKKIVKFTYPIRDQVVDTIGRFWNTFIRGVILVASIGIVLNLSGLAVDVNAEGIHIDTIQHTRELKQFRAEYENK